ncbi:MAG: hypothetical protein AB8G15_10890 [Saprospiraceae bacterium]
MKLWRRYVIIFVSICCFPIVVSQACGPDDWSFYGYSFIQPEIVNKTTPYAPFFLRFDDFYQSVSPTVVQEKSNLEEWKERFCALVDLKDLKTVIYQSSLGRLESLRQAVKNKKTPLPVSLQANSFARHLKSNRCTEVIDYLIFAKTCEPHVTWSNTWEKPQRDSSAMMELVVEGKKAFLDTESHYVRLRYAYQLIRLAHYAKAYPQVLALYDFLLPKTDAHASILDYWILGHKAGALYRLNRRVEAAYLYSLVFKNSAAKRQSAYQSFKIRTDEEWEQCLLMCKSDQERSVLYAIRANAPLSIAAEEMDKIYQLDPVNENLELLLVKEIKLLEKDLLGLKFNIHRQRNKDQYQIPRKTAGRKLTQLQQFVRKCNQEQLVARPAIWKIADAYLEFLAGDLYAAEKTFIRIKPEITQDSLQAQVEIFELCLKLNQMDTIGSTEEEFITTIVRNNDLLKKYPDLSNFLYDRITQLYQKQGKIGKAFRCQYDIQELAYNPQIDIIDSLLFLSQREDKNRFERMLCLDAEGNEFENFLLDLKGTLLFSQNQPEAALEIFKSIPPAERSKYKLNPFHENLHDCVECPIKDTLWYNKAELIERIFELEYQAKADLKNGPRYFYILGLAYYNMSYFGNSWNAMDAFRSSTTGSYLRPNQVYDLYGSPFGNLEQTDCSQALNYFEKARLLSKSPELAARASFMAAKCSQKMYLTSEANNYSPYSNRIPNLSEEYLVHFKILQQEYSDTKFYQEIIQECKYFNAYVSKN